VNEFWRARLLPNLAVLRTHARTLFLGALTVASALGLKAACGDASADALYWVLMPSCWVAEQLGNLQLHWEPLTGFISHDARMLVGPPCAGVTFLAVAWLALYFGSQAAFTSWPRKLAWYAASLLLAYVATNATNGLRVVLAAHLHQAGVHTALLSPARIHRLLGIVLYCAALLGLCGVAQRWVGGTWRHRVRTCAMPFAWYVTVVVLIPVARRAYVHDPSRFVEHVTLTLGAGSLVVAAFWLGSLLVDRLSCSRS